MITESLCFCFFFFNDTATTEIYTLSLHDALPIYQVADVARRHEPVLSLRQEPQPPHGHAPSMHRGCDRNGGILKGRLVISGTGEDRKSTRLNSSHLVISYAVFCLKKKTVMII